MVALYALVLTFDHDPHFGWQVFFQRLAVALNRDILTTLTNISALGNKQRMGDPGYCGKGQWVPVCDGGPLVRIEDCLIGGSA